MRPRLRHQDDDDCPSCCFQWLGRRIKPASSTITARLLLLIVTILLLLVSAAQFTWVVVVVDNNEQSSFLLPTSLAINHNNKKKSTKQRQRNNNYDNRTVDVNSTTKHSDTVIDIMHQEDHVSSNHSSDPSMKNDNNNKWLRKEEEKNRLLENEQKNINVDTEDSSTSTTRMRTLSEDFVEFSNVCLDSISKDEATITNMFPWDDAHSSDDHPMEFPYEYWGGLAADKMFRFVVVIKETTMTQQEQHQPFVVVYTNQTTTSTITRNSNISFLPDTTLFATTHHCDNFFHLHNDFLLPLFLAKQDNINATRVYLLAGSRLSWSKRIVPATDAILKLLFPNGVYYPLEEQVQQSSIRVPHHRRKGHDKNSKQEQNHVLCFERLILSHLYSPKLRMNRPFYAHHGRYTQRWDKSLVNRFRDFIWIRLGLVGVDDDKGDNAITKNNENSTARQRQQHADAKEEEEQPLLLWIPRGKNDSRRILNQDELLKLLSTHFQVQLLSFTKEKSNNETTKNYTEEERMHLMFKSQLELIQKAQVMMGVHGAGLTNAIYMRDDDDAVMTTRTTCMLVELVHGFAPNKRVFLNIASKKQNLPYYAFDTQPYTTNTSIPWDSPVFLPKDVMQNLVKDLWNRYQTEKAMLNHHDSNNMESTTSNHTGECLFPSVQRKTLLKGKLTETNVSRCYLELYGSTKKSRNNKQRWKTCSEHACQKLPLDLTE